MWPKNFRSNSSSWPKKEAHEKTRAQRSRKRSLSRCPLPSRSHAVAPSSVLRSLAKSVVAPSLVHRPPVPCPRSRRKARRQGRLATAARPPVSGEPVPCRPAWLPAGRRPLLGLLAPRPRPEAVRSIAQKQGRTRTARSPELSQKLPAPCLAAPLFACVPAWLPPARAQGSRSPLCQKRGYERGVK